MTEEQGPEKPEEDEDQITLPFKEDAEFKEFRDLMVAPDEFEDGFGWGSAIMAIIVGVLMVPSQIYLNLVAGMSLGGATQWVTVILYTEVARRAFKTLKRPEIFVLFYMCGAVLGTSGAAQGLLWKQFMVQSESLRNMGILEYIPSWYAPSDPGVLAQRSFFMTPWLVPILLMIFNNLMDRLDNFGLGYIMFRLTSDVERLPFPMAPVGAMGMTALADASSEKESWRWRTFCFGGVIGMVFGAVYIGLPTVTGAFFSGSIQIIPMPFVDWTKYVEWYLPAMPFLISFDLGMVISGMVVPFWGVMGSVIGLIFTMVANPVLYHMGVLKTWEPGLGGIKTLQANTMDFYFSFGLGLTFAVAIVGFYQLYRGLKNPKKTGKKIHWDRLLRPPAKRGDIPISLAVVIYIFSTSIYVVLCWFLINRWSGPLIGAPFPLWLLLFFAFVYSPVITYVSTRLEGIVGQQVAVPFLREAAFILSGYKGAAIWFAPIPMQSHAGQAVFFRQMELTGTKVKSVIKAELLILPITVVGLIVFSQFIWSMGPVPSAMFPYTEQFWELQAFGSGIMISSTLPGDVETAFLTALKPGFVGAGLLMALAAFAGLSHFGLPIFLIYGVIQSLGQSTPQAVIPMLFGALLGRYVFRKRFGDRWPQYRVVTAAGFGAGMGLISMLCLGIVLVMKSVVSSQF